jgi:hypothetical protein
MWSSFSPTTRFSIIAFVITLVLGLLSMGALGYGLYYLVKPILGERIEELKGDTSWPSMILAGMAWSFGFLIAAGLLRFLSKFNLPAFLNYSAYALVLWLWVLMVWWCIIEFRLVK